MLILRYFRVRGGANLTAIKLSPVVLQTVDVIPLARRRGLGGTTATFFNIFLRNKDLSSPPLNPLLEGGEANGLNLKSFFLTEWQ